MAPVGDSSSRKPSSSPPNAGWTARTTGKSGDAVLPATNAQPDAVTATARPTSLPLPPREEANSSAPAGEKRETNASTRPPGVARQALRTGRLVDRVDPVVLTLPAAST